MAKYTEWIDGDGIEKIKAWARDGITEENIAKKMSIAYSTLKEWKKKFPSISAALKRGKEIVDIEVENSLFKKATGHKVSVKKAFKVKRTEYDPVSGKKIREEERIEYGYDEVYIPPDTLAMIYWLNNRKPNEWRNKRDNCVVEDNENNGVVLLAPVDMEANDEYSVEATT